MAALPLHLDTFTGSGSTSAGFTPSYRSDPSPSSEPLNPFFRSRYDWSETELGQLSSAARHQKGKLKANLGADDDDEDERKLPLKKSGTAAAAAASTVAATQPAKQKPPTKKK